MARDGVRTGAAGRNWDSYGKAVAAPVPDWQRDLLCDPQTSGGLLVAAAADAAEAVLAMVRAAGYPAAAIVGTLQPGQPGIEVV